jgi:hypothetical protein
LSHAGAQTPLYCALSPDVKGFTFYHNVLGIISSSAASYDVSRQVPHYDAAMDMVKQGSSSRFAVRAAKLPQHHAKRNGVVVDLSAPPSVQLVEKGAAVDSNEVAGVTDEGVSKGDDEQGVGNAQ